jgi:hypothetical protein
MIMKDFNAEAYAIVIHTRDLMERAFALYHAASRDEYCEYQIESFQYELQEVAKAFGTFTQSTQTQEGTN